MYTCTSVIAIDARSSIITHSMDVYLWLIFCACFVFQSPAPGKKGKASPGKGKGGAAPPPDPAPAEPTAPVESPEELAQRQRKCQLYKEHKAAIEKEGIR